jgi:fructokinase
MAHTLVATTGPFRIAIGGGVVTRQPHLLAQIETEMEISLAGYMALPPRRPIIVAPALGELAGPLGSIALAMAASAQ